MLIRASRQSTDVFKKQHRTVSSGSGDPRPGLLLRFGKQEQPKNAGGTEKARVPSDNTGYILSLKKLQWLSLVRAASRNCPNLRLEPYRTLLNDKLRGRLFLAVRGAETILSALSWSFFLFVIRASSPARTRSPSFIKWAASWWCS